MQYDQRLCSCGAVQTEEHVVKYCPLVDGIRNNYPNWDFTFPTMFDNENNELFALYHIMKHFE